MGKSGMPVLAPSVQELAKQSLTKVPEKYIYPNQDPPIVFNKTNLPQLPIVDLQKLLSSDLIELEKMDHACKEWGFFQLVNHGVNTSLIENLKNGVQEFFNLPIEEKKKYWQTQEEIQGFGQVYVALEEEKLRWGDMFFVHTYPLHARHPHLIPSIPEPLRENLESYCLELKKMSVTIIELMTKALKIESNELLELFEEMNQSMRINYYPPCPEPEKVIGLNPHSDASALSILLQVDETEGLQVKKDGMWIPIKPLPNAFVINVGDMIEILTNGIYRSIDHRATVNSEKERISIAMFHFAQMESVLSPTPSLITHDRPALYKRIGVADYTTQYLSSKIKGKKHLDLLRIHNEISK